MIDEGSNKSSECSLKFILRHCAVRGICVTCGPVLWNNPFAGNAPSSRFSGELAVFFSFYQVSEKDIPSVNEIEGD